MVGELDYRHLSTVLDYLAIEVITMYETNVKQHFVEYVERFVNVAWEKKALVAIIKKHETARRRAATNALCNQLRRIKTDLLSPDQPKRAHPTYHAWIDEQRLAVLPHRALRKGSVHYDIQCSPQDYLRPMLYMMRAVEARGASVSNVFPLRSAIAPGHIPHLALPHVGAGYAERVHEEGQPGQAAVEGLGFLLQDQPEVLPHGRRARAHVRPSDRDGRSEL
jgi:hypothetical protein